MHLVHDNVLNWCKTYTGEPFHALLCDPPYHLTSGNVGVDWSSFQTDKGATNLNGRGHRSSKGFMGKTWDGGDIAFRPDTWAALAQHLHPGAFGMAFAGSRGWHRLAVAIEDAGLIIHPSVWKWQDKAGNTHISTEEELVAHLLAGHVAGGQQMNIPSALLWNYASGFPKATRIDSQIDKAAGKAGTWEQSEHPGRPGPRRSKSNAIMGQGDHTTEENPDGLRHVYVPATPLAAAWAGHRYGLQAIKPAVEPVIVFQKPYQGRPVDSITATGAGALWIDGGRIAAEPMERTNGRPEAPGWGLHQRQENWANASGRWPANLALIHTDRCTADACDPACPVERLGAQSGERPSGGANGERRASSNLCMSGPNTARITTDGRDSDTGTAARFFYQADWMYERLEDADPVRYCAKASTAEREAGLGDFPMKSVEEISGGGGYSEEYQDKFQARKSERRNIHPTLKPLSLCKWLATLLLPPCEYAPRRLLIPFAGAGSEMIGAHLAGWEKITGIELESDHVAIARSRLEWWRTAARRLMTTDVETILRLEDEASMPSLFD